jgi:thiosulfate dehydrogenase (quinone) large subunit
MATSFEGRVPVGHVPGAVHQTGSWAAVVPYVWAVTRLCLAWIFLWAFLDKTFGWGHETTSGQAWVNGGSPTKGFLTNTAAGPFKSFYRNIAGDTWADWLFMIGLLGIGLALLLGIVMRITAAAGVVLYLMMWSVVLPPPNNPFMDDHIFAAIVLVGLAAAGAGATLGLGQWWRRTALVGKYAWLE